MSTPTFVLWLDRTLDGFVRREIMRQPLAKAFNLSAYAEAEAGDEGLVFERALKRASDPQVEKMIRLHDADEQRHARMFEERREELELPRFPIPRRLRTIERLSELAGGVLDRPMTSDEDVVAAYQLLFVVEERATLEFSRAIVALEATGDEETAEVFRQIAQDEVRHLAYCKAVGRKYEASPGAFEEGLETFRQLEAESYKRQAEATVDHMIEVGALQLRGARGLVIRAILAVGRGLRIPRPAQVLLAAA